MTATALVLNAGSTNLKYAGFAAGRRAFAGTVDGGGAAVAEVLAAVPKDCRIAAVGHRVVHGGDLFTAPVRVAADVLAGIESLAPLAPLHQPRAVAAMRQIERDEPGVPQVACFDTAFHATMPDVEKRFALPRDLFDRGVKRFGFHGLSYEGAAGALRAIDPVAAAGKVIVAHLGGGASLCGMIDGQSVTTTMGFTPLDGLVMATRCGRLDPGVILYLLRTGMTADALEDLLEHRSGLKGVSGLSGDVRELEASTSAEAKLALELFARSVAKEIAAAAVALGGLDGVAFTGGVGEHSAAVRGAVCGHLEFLGVRADSAANAGHRTTFHIAGSAVKLFVVPADEEAVIAGHVARLLGVSL